MNNSHSTYKPKEIRCRCELCNGRVWTLAEIRQLPNFPGTPVNGMTLGKIGTAVGHKFYYPEIRAVGTWKAKTKAIARSSAHTPYQHNTDPEALDLLPINGMRLSATDGPGEVGT